MTNEVFAYYAGKTNAGLLNYVKPLWHRPGDWVLDPTHGQGNWCKVFPPEHLICHDLYTRDGVDYRYPVEEPGSTDLILFDPDYVSRGSQTSSKLTGMHTAFGMRNCGWEQCFDDVAAGIKAQAQLLTPTGRMLTKTEMYTESGAKHNGLKNVYDAAVESGLEVLGQVFHHTGPRTQPPGRRQLTVHEVGAFLICLGAPKARRYLARTTPHHQGRRA